MKHGHVIHQSGIAQLFAIMVAMDTKVGTIYCAVSDVGYFVYICNSNSLKILLIVMQSMAY